MQATKTINCGCEVGKKNILIGKVVEILVDPVKPRVVGFVVKKNRWLSSAKFIEIERVIEYWKKVFELNSKTVDKKARIRCKNIFTSKILVLGRRAYDIDGNKLGYVSDIYYSIDNGWIDRFVVERGVGFWKKSRILPATKFVEANRAGVVFDVGDTLIKAKAVVGLELVN